MPPADLCCTLGHGMSDTADAAWRARSLPSARFLLRWPMGNGLPKSETGVSALERMLTRRIVRPKPPEPDKVRIVPPGTFKVPDGGFVLGRRAQ